MADQEPTSLCPMCDGMIPVSQIDDHYRDHGVPTARSFPQLTDRQCVAQALQLLISATDASGEGRERESAALILQALILLRRQLGPLPEATTGSKREGDGQ